MGQYSYSSEWATYYGLPCEQWEVAVEKYKTPFGRRVVVAVRQKSTGKELNDTVVGSKLSKRDLDKHADRLVKELATRLGYQPASSKGSKKRKKKR